MEDSLPPTKKQRLNEISAFNEVVQSSAFAYASSSSTQPKSRCNVFVNHKGEVKKTLARAICCALFNMGVKTFLDEKDLEEGDLIPQVIEEAMKNASLHVAIFSKSYAESPWCLAELSYMLKTKVKIIPIFYDVEASDLRWLKKGKGKYVDSFSKLEDSKRYTPTKLTEWKEALHTVSYRKGFEITKDDWNSVLENLSHNVAKEMSKPQAAGKSPDAADAVGLVKARDHVIGLLENLADQSTRKIVVVYGVAGIGKTTLASAVFNTLTLTAYKHCRVDIEQNCSLSDIKSLQEQILRDLFNKKVEFRSCVEGREQLSEAFRKSTEPLFMFIDNARGSDLAMLLPKDLSCLPVRSRVLITTRKLDETNVVLHPLIQRCAYRVEPLPGLEAKQLLRMIVLGSGDASFGTDKDIDDLVECCGGIPLVLELVGKNLLSDGIKVSSHWVKFLNETVQQGEGDLSESVVDCVYNSLRDSYKEAFLDVACFFHNKSREDVAKIVGEVEMKGMEDAALVKTSGRRNTVTMHDIVRARGKWLSKSDRITITDIESLKAVLGDREKLQRLKGISIEYSKEKMEIPAKNLDLTSQTLRILQVKEKLGVNVNVKGRCKRPFENLRFLNLGDSKNNTCLSMRLNSLKRLAVCHGNSLSMNDYDCLIAESLRVLKLKSSSTLPDSLGALSLLEELKLDECTFVSLPHSLGQLKSLRHLRLGHCQQLTSLPESLGNLSSLEKLCLVKCRKLEGLPESVSQLSSLQELSIPFCENLSSLPKRFGELKSLKYLDLENCISLGNLSEDFGHLTSLAAMKAKGCSKLEGRAIDTLVKLKNLMFLNIEESPMLKDWWEQKKEQIEEHYSLLVCSTREYWARIWQKQFRQIMSLEFFQSEGRLVQLDDGGKLVEWIPSFSSLGGQAKLGVLFTMCDLCAPSNNEVLKTVKEKCTELRHQGFHIVYVELVGESGELSQQSKQHIRHALVSLDLSPGTIACFPPPKIMSQLFSYCLFSAWKGGSELFCNEQQPVELILELPKSNTFVVEVKPLDSQQSEHSVDESEWFDQLAFFC